MTYPRARLTVAALLFAAWLGYLLLLAVVTRHTIVLSRPQFLVSDLWVLAELTTGKDGRPAPKAAVRELFWYRNPALLTLKDQAITVSNLPEAGPQGYIGPGKYILPLRKLEEAGVPRYVVTPVPSSPGYVAAFVNVGLMAAGAEPEHVAHLAVDILEMDAKEARERVNVVREGGFTTLVRAVPRAQAMAFVHAAEEMGKSAPEVTISPDDVRIYPWTPETKEQIEELVAAR